MSRYENDHPEHTFAALSQSDEQLAKLSQSPYTKPASADRVAKAKAGLEAKGFKVTEVPNRAAAFDALKAAIPKGASVNNAHSTTLEELGFITYLKGETEWDNVHHKIILEKDPAKQANLRRTVGSTVDYYITSVAAVTENGELAHGDLSGSKVGGVAFGAGNVIVVVGSNKIVKDLDEAKKRAFEFALPAESARIRNAYKLPGSNLTHFEIINTASPFAPGRIQVILVDEALGY
ncbi:hypothetical protein DFQ27_004683 [Actinomortierella ambigua]|uniref:LUD domain-containing protein n=1 Tax=Actinomortierella ambigua TaxID=1343610 RepID=A0A9P6Q4B6_9FUNG|nr:hypothetical protein DFQ26_004996 [Actinomortierella ambigua]KAG0258370.1 hypothetical protein DFQ27_004683 [Actinomortierella ambigua]